MVAVAGTRDWTLSKIRWSESVQNGPKTVDNGLKKSRMTKKYSALAIHLMQCIFQGFRYTLVVIQLCIYGVYYTRDCIFFTNNYTSLIIIRIMFFFVRKHERNFHKKRQICLTGYLIYEI